MSAENIKARFADSIFMQGKFVVGERGEVNVTAERVPTSTIIMVLPSPGDVPSSSCEVHIVKGENSAFRI